MSGKSVQKVSGKSVHGVNGDRYSRIPQSVLCDADLSCAAKCVYGVLALSVFQGNVAKMGQRLIAKKLGINKETVGLAIAELKNRGHIFVVGKGKQRRWYELVSRVFGSKQRAGVEELASSPSGGKRLVSVASA